ncbi:hypothetical protein MRX96_048561 [Rhipicephalus microplus]
MIPPARRQSAPSTPSRKTEPPPNGCRKSSKRARVINKGILSRFTLHPLFLSFSEAAKWSFLLRLGAGREPL